MRRRKVCDGQLSESGQAVSGAARDDVKTWHKPARDGGVGADTTASFTSTGISMPWRTHTMVPHPCL